MNFPLVFRRAALVLSGALPLLAQGFGGGVGTLVGKHGETMALTRKLPPVVDLAGSSVKVVVSKTGSIPPEIVDIMQTKLRADLLKDRARGIRLDDPKPQTELRCRVTSFELVEQDQRRDEGSVTGIYKVIIGNMEASVEVYDLKTGQALDSENLKNKYEKWFKTQEVQNNNKNAIGNIFNKKPKVDAAMRLPTMTERYQAVVEGISSQVAQRLVPVDERIEIPLPGGKLKDLAGMAQRGQWGRVLEDGEKMGELPKPTDDAYRLYLLALANEALGYSSKSDTEAQDYLLKSTTLYEQARNAKKDEEKFKEPDIRVRESVERYERIKVIRQKAIAHGGKMPSPPPEAPAPEKKSEPERKPVIAESKPAVTPVTDAKSNEYNNDYVLELKKANLPADFIVDEVKNAQNPKFDVTPQAVLVLAKAGVPAPVITAMRERMRRATAPAKPAAPKPVVTTPAPKPPAAAPAVKPVAKT